MQTNGTQWRIGEVARAAGVTVRTLHHYDELGLLVPSVRSQAGHRLYGDGDLHRLYEVLALRRLGLPLDEVKRSLDDDGQGLAETVRRQLERLDQELALRQRLRGRLIAIQDVLAAGGEPSRDQLIDAIEVMTMHEKYYTPEQLEQLERRREDLGHEAIRAAEGQWAELFAELEAERERGADPSSPRVQELVGRWDALVEQFTGGDAGIRRSLQTMYEQEGPANASRGMVDAELMAYAQRAREAGPARRAGPA